jgi:PKD repeat protein
LLPAKKGEEYGLMMPITEGWAWEAASLRSISRLSGVTLIAALIGANTQGGQVPQMFQAANRRTGVSMPIAEKIYFSAAPTSGQAPLGVQFYATGGHRYAIDFGDGETGLLTSPCDRAGTAGGSTCPPPGAYHTYRSGGSYTAELRWLTTSLPDASPNPPSPAARVTITVTAAPEK